MAVRLALGASRRRLVGQLLTESLLLSALAAVASSALVVIAGRWIAQISLPVAEPLALDLTVDWRVLAFTAGLCIGTTMLFGLVPALQSSGIQVLPGLKEGVTTTPGRGRTRLRAVLMTTQVALSTLLLIAAGVLVRSITSARSYGHRVLRRPRSLPRTSICRRCPIPGNAGWRSTRMRSLVSSRIRGSTAPR